MARPVNNNRLRIVRYLLHINILGIQLKKKDQCSIPKYFFRYKFVDQRANGTYTVPAGTPVQCCLIGAFRFWLRLKKALNGSCWTTLLVTSIAFIITTSFDFLLLSCLSIFIRSPAGGFIGLFNSSIAPHQTAVSMSTRETLMDMKNTIVVGSWPYTVQ